MSGAAQEPIVKEVPSKSADLSAWYTAVCLRAQLVSYAPVRGCVVLRPYGYSVWEHLQAELDRRFKATGHENAYFPLLIPEHLLQRESEHVEGFTPEVAWVTQGGGERLEERLAIRPTSEALFGAMYARWIESYRDLPLLINQWANVLRWEKATRPFLRTMEFLWQEGHTAHATAAEARAETEQMLEVYRSFAEEIAAVPVYAGIKSSSERFPGAVETYSIEALMPDGRALQSATSHDLGQNFSKAYDITFTAKDGKLQHVYTTSWGMSWRMIGGMIMVHGDDRGLRIPPKLAPLDAVIVPIVRADSTAEIEAAHELAGSLRGAGYAVRVDDREYKPGWKFAEWEMRGVPLRIELGPRDLKARSATVVRRDKTKADGDAKVNVALERLPQTMCELLDDVQASLFEQAREFLRSHTLAPQTADQFFSLCRDRAGMIDIPWCGRLDCEAKVKAETGATTRVLRALQEAATRCTACGEPAVTNAYFAQSY